MKPQIQLLYSVMNEEWDPRAPHSKIKGFYMKITCRNVSKTFFLIGASHVYEDDPTFLYWTIARHVEKQPTLRPFFQEILTHEGFYFHDQWTDTRKEFELMKEFNPIHVKKEKQPKTNIWANTASILYTCLMFYFLFDLMVVLCAGYLLGGILLDRKYLKQKKIGIVLKGIKDSMVSFFLTPKYAGQVVLKVTKSFQHEKTV